MSATTHPPETSWAILRRWPRGSDADRLQWLLAILALAVVYVVAARIGFSHAFTAKQVSPVWPPTGIALAALILWGYRYWPGIVLGAFVANVVNDVPAAAALGIAIGNTLEALTGAWLLQRVARFDEALSRVRDVVGLIAFAACLSTTISATIGVVSLTLADVYMPGLRRGIDWADYGSLWWTWWLGDAMGALVVAPVILTWVSDERRWRLRHVVEPSLLMAGVVTTSIIVFTGWVLPELRDASLAYAVFPFVAWAAMRFGQRGTATVIFVASTIAILGSVRGYGPFGIGPAHERLLVLQAFMGVVAVTGLLLGAALFERRRAESDVREGEARLRLALEAGRMGAWEWRLSRNELIWSAALEELHGLPPGSFEGTFEAFLETIHPDDREMVQSTVVEALARGKRFHVEYRIVRPDGSICWIEDRGSVIDARGTRPSVMTGVSVDITARKRDDLRLATLHAVTRSLAESATLDDAAPQVIDAVCRNLAWRVGSLWLLDVEAQTLRCVEVRHIGASGYPQFEAATRSQTLESGTGLPGRVWATGKPAWIADVAADDNFPRAPHAAAEGLRSAFALPISLGGAVLGVLEFFSPEVRSPDPEVLRLLGTIGSQVGQFISRKRGEKALRDSELRSRSVVDHIVDGVITIDERGVIASFNPAAERLFGSSAAAVIGQNFKLLMPEPFHSQPDEYIANYLRTGRAKFIGSGREVAGRRRDGSTFPLELAVSEFQLGARRYFTGIVRDITERKRTEESLRTSQQQTRSIIENAYDAFIAMDAEGAIRDWNPQAEVLLGWQREEAIGQKLADLIIPARYREAHGRGLRRFLATGEGPVLDRRVELSALRRDGSEIPVELMVSAIPSQDGFFFSAFLHDITDRKRTEATFRFLAEASASLGTLVDYESTLKNVSRLAVPFFADYCAVDSADETGTLRRVAVTHIHAVKASVLAELDRRYADEPSPKRGPLPVFRSGRSEMVAYVTDSVLGEISQDPEHLRLLRSLELRSYICVPLVIQGKTRGVMTFGLTEGERHYGPDDLAIAEDLVHRAAVAIENARLYAELRDADRRKDEFLAMLAHELRNPLAPIRSGLDLLEMENVDTETSSWVRKTMREQLVHMVRLIDDLLDVSRIMTGKIQLRTERLLLVDIVERAVAEVRPQFDAQEQQLSVELPSEPIWLEADPVRLAQVIANLLNNAAKYTDRGGHVWLRVKPVDGYVELKVRDTGIGLTPEMQQHVFELFAQADPSIERTRGGLGIGLTVVRRLTELHGGRVDVFSAGPGTGSEFTVTLPRLPASAAELTASASKPRVSGKPSSARHVLVVDDNADAAAMLATLLENWGHMVDVAHDGPEAVATFRASPADVVLLDIGLPKMNGYEVAREIRRGSDGCQPLLVAVTGYGQKEDRDRSRAAGFDMHLVKPLAIDDLQAIFDGSTQETR